MHGDASLGELKMTIVRTCAFHFMKNSKKIVKKILPISNRNMEKWILSLLMNRDNMQNLDGTVKLVVIVMCFKFITPCTKCASLYWHFKQAYQRFQGSFSDQAKEYIDIACAEVGSHAIHKKKSSDYQSEEDFYMKCEVSPFKRHTRYN